MVSSGWNHARDPGGLSDSGLQCLVFFKKTLTSHPAHRIKIFHSAGVTQLVECNLAKVDVASSSLVTRSTSLAFA